MELRLRDHLAKLFTAQHPSKDVRESPRAMAKLLKEANRLKTVLSANADHMAQVWLPVTALRLPWGWRRGSAGGPVSGSAAPLRHRELWSQRPGGWWHRGSPQPVPT